MKNEEPHVHNYSSCEKKHTEDEPQSLLHMQAKIKNTGVFWQWFQISNHVDHNTTKSNVKIDNIGDTNRYSIHQSWLFRFINKNTNAFSSHGWVFKLNMFTQYPVMIFTVCLLDFGIFSIRLTITAGGKCTIKLSCVCDIQSPLLTTCLQLCLGFPCGMKPFELTYKGYVSLAQSHS